jgi:SAM-dependent methyltransferase
MRIGALAPYEEALRGGTALALMDRGGGRIPLDVERWLGDPDDADRSVLRRCADPVLDIGSGPGRMVRALTRRGHRALGIDIAAEAVSQSLRSGAPATRADIFGSVPGEGSWSSALLIDGNVGIGGDVTALLARVATVLRPGGVMLVEAGAEPDQDEVLDARFASGGRLEPAGPSFRWALVGQRALRRHANRAAVQVLDEWSLAGRFFCALSAARR